MSPEVIARKLSRMSQYLQDVAPYKTLGYKDFMTDHYKLERLIELLLMTASDIVFHLLSMKGEAPPGSYRAAFLRAGEIGMLSEKLGRNLSLGAGLRNILVHEYEEIDYQLLHRSVPQIIEDLTDFVEEVTSQL
jgi:uncharacterized protein YutE (UPF0331/DUF86 family)